MSVNPKEILHQYWGYDDFIPPQAQIIQSVLDGHDTLALLPTGGGKSITFQVPILLQPGICLVISPLIALMKDQIKNLKEKGIKAALITSELTHQDVDIILDNCRFGGIKILYISPERVQTKRFQLALETLDIAYIAVDEAHCISEWGHDFRPAYLALKTIKEILPNKPILALTATATPYIQKEIIKELELSTPHIFKSSLERKNLAFRIIESKNKYQDLIDLLRQYPGASIVFCRTRKETFEVATFLKEQGFNSDFYHARLAIEDKNRKQKAFIASDDMVLASTNAFGMGIDKPDIRNVFHLSAPNGLESYIQEVGRAGRDGKMARGFLFYDEKDKKNAYKTFRTNLANKEAFQDIIRKLYNYFQIGDHELLEGQKAFSERKFRKRYDLHKQKTRNIIQFLQQQRVIDIQRAQHQSLVKILIRNVDIVDGKHPRSKILSYLARHYGGIFQEPKPVDEFIIAKRLKMSYRLVKDSLKQLHEKEIVFYRDAAIVKISFLEPRDDNHTKVNLYKKYEKLQKIRWTRLQAMYYFIENDTVCKNQMILRYFGEKSTQKCGICSVCKPKENNKRIHKEEILQYLDGESKSKNELFLSFAQYDKKDIVKTLQLLLDEGEISFQLPNIYSK